jgi:hypothetical protein
MKRVLIVWILCLAASAGSFGVLLVEDRKLGLPLPYTLPLAFLGMLVAGPILQMLAAKAWPQPKIVVRPAIAPAPVTAASPEPAAVTTPRVPVAVPATARARAAAQGVVLFDMSRVANRRPAA